MKKVQGNEVRHRIAITLAAELGAAEQSVARDDVAKEVMARVGASYESDGNPEEMSPQKAAALVSRYVSFGLTYCTMLLAEKGGRPNGKFQEKNRISQYVGP